MSNRDHTMKVALIGLLGTVVTAVLASPVLIELLREDERQVGQSEAPSSGELLPQEEPPEFVTSFVYPTEWFERTAFEFEESRFSEEEASGLISLKRVAFSHPGELFQVQATVTNTSPDPILLDLDHRYFTLEDNLGRKAVLVAFCCPSQGDMLSPREERDVQLFFRSSGWHGKEVAAHTIFFRVRGFLPVVEASWSMPVLATAD